MCTSERIHPQGICTDSYSPSSVTELLQKNKIFSPNLTIIFVVMYVQCTSMHEGKVPRWLEIHVLVISQQFCWKSSIHPTDLK